MPQKQEDHDVSTTRVDRRLLEDMSVKVNQIYDKMFVGSKENPAITTRLERLEVERDVQKKWVGALFVAAVPGFFWALWQGIRILINSGSGTNGSH